MVKEGLESVATYIFISGLIGRGEIGVESGQANHRPYREETDDRLQYSDHG